MSSLKCSSNFTFLFFRVPSCCTNWCVLPVIKSGALKENVLMTDRRWLTEVGVSGQAMQNVHIPVVVVHSTEQELALIPRKYICILFHQQFVITAFTWNIFIWGLITLQPKIDDGPSSLFLFFLWIISHNLSWVLLIGLRGIKHTRVFTVFAQLVLDWGRIF